MARVLISVTHLLGTGHLSRALTLARAFGTAGHEAHVMSGGMPVAHLPTDGVTLHQLPPVKSDGVNFTDLLCENGPVDDTYLQARKRAAINTLTKVRPDVFITELYPFGRRVLKAEFLAMLNTARDMAPKPLILCSVRDILAPPSKPKKALETEAVIAGYYDGVLVHSVGEITPLDVSWPVTNMLREKLLYTGYVAPELAPAHPQGVGTGEVLVTAGGGDVGMGLFRAALQAAALDPDTPYRVLVGGAAAQSNIAALFDEGLSDNVTIEPTRPDFRQMLPLAKAAICMCGYNTALDVLQSGLPAVFVPFDAGGEVEQTLRAESLSKTDGYAVIKSSDANGETLSAALRSVCAMDVRPMEEGQFQGAAQTVQSVENKLAAMR
ncbi:glycosyltransferase [Amylibacter sp. IMCC11727]|uniref:glycosyltransferase family protein n=1 Tax=Amylibacter sp. IMCC11727 TaxID=3039851 RepID=UPI00244DCDAA|nr:glycosyltransferase [Amylibacter sp. IMCC11727]WGI22245.1 glycosyltransferase [Amylibacter sp. IMCC11727]